jgi:hypothetical protein
VVDLVEQPPQRVGFVARAVPPVEDEGRHEVGDDAAGGRADVLGKTQQRSVRSPALPGDPGEDDDRELRCVDGEDAPPPAANDRQPPAGPQPLEHEAEREGGEDDRQHAGSRWS